MQACEFVGLPECQLTLAQAVTYLACAPKSNAATVAIGEARQDVREGRLLPVPVHLRDCPLRRRPAVGTRGRATSTRTMMPKVAWRRRTIWASIASTTGRSSGGLKPSSHDV